ncbi:MAG TPA: VanW family protein [Candidatus Methylomirabilis sp.]|nr:VanW family protein [Candidatus Methylomirabilis sp.]
MPKPLPYKALLTWTAAAFGVAVAVGGLGFFAVVGYARLYEGRVFPGVRVLGVRLDGLTADEARDTLHKAVDQALKDGLRFRYVADERAGRAREVALDATTVAPNDPDAGRDLVSYDLDPAVVAAMGYGRSDNAVFDTFARWRARVTPVHMQVKLDMNEDAIKEALATALKDAIPETRNAWLDATWDPKIGMAATAITPERAGKELRFDPALRALRAQAERLRFEPILLEVQTQSPTVTTKDVEERTNDVAALLAHAPVRLTYDGKSFTVTTSTLATWLNVVREDGITALTIDPERFAKGVRQLAPDVEKTAKKGTLVIEDGKLKSFEAGTEGVAIDDAPTRRAILDAWAGSATTTSFPIQVVREEAALTGADPERLGIREIIGIGRSNFSGSPANRRKNIATGVKKVNGSLIAPGEEFSLLTALGPITANNGWLPELVIKGNKTEPELGGGLCQIGTTTFRAALASGLPITERRNHSYRVRYYEPAGTDATIYEPRPDFRFLNDTKNHVLIHAYLDGDNVLYEFWGTEDGRKVEQSKPRIFNVTSPPPKKLVETLDLPPGKTKCTEVAHAGADAEFTYKVTYGDGTVKEEVFRSHYRPWQAVCLVGVEKLTEPPKEEGAEQPAEGSADVTVVQ